MKYSGVIVSHEELSLLLWKKNDSKSYCKLATLVFQLRQKIEIDPKNPRFVQTIRGKGYKLIL
ncbi:winged helix-turn-helix domain-containing protein [Enterococcus termitis]|uniref:winged helix-turn-helix domain-containing protein n=1 Tax=Enterococcus termitis TaxID=332950 RepID=UPI0036333938